MNKRGKRRAKRMMKNQLEAFEELVAVGANIVQRWAPAADVGEPHISILMALQTFVDAAYASKKSQTAKSQAVSVALRAAYLYGRFGSKLPKQPRKPIA